MKWIKWTLDNLPMPKQRVLIAYKSGLVGAIDFFHNQQAKDDYITGTIWMQENPNADLGGEMQNYLKDLSESDPIIAWMPCPKSPEDEYEMD